MTTIKYITYTPIERKALDLFLANPQKEINTLDLRKQGILHPANAISSLKKKGAIFEVRLKDHKPLFQKGYKRIAHYKFVGWLDE